MTSVNLPMPWAHSLYIQGRWPLARERNLEGKPPSRITEGFTAGRTNYSTDAGCEPSVDIGHPSHGSNHGKCSDLGLGKGFRSTRCATQQSVSLCDDVIDEKNSHGIDELGLHGNRIVMRPGIGAVAWCLVGRFRYLANTAHIGHDRVRQTLREQRAAYTLAHPECGVVPAGGTARYRQQQRLGAEKIRKRAVVMEQANALGHSGKGRLMSGLDPIAQPP